MTNCEGELGAGVCGAENRAGAPCRKHPMEGKTRCAMHGGKSTGPKTEEGKLKARVAPMVHGAYTRGLMNCSICSNRCERYEEDNICTYEEKIYAELMDFFDKQKDMTLIDRTIFENAVMAQIQMLRGIRNSAAKGQCFDFSRIGDHILRSFRDLKLSKIVRDKDGSQTQPDIMSLLANFYRKYPKKEPDNCLPSPPTSLSPSPGK